MSGVHHLLPPGRVTHHSPLSVGRFLTAVNQKLPKERSDLDPGLKGETNFGEQSHLKLFWKDS
jgi:hypothetical protein